MDPSLLIANCGLSERTVSRAAWEAWRERAAPIHSGGMQPQPQLRRNQVGACGSTSALSYTQPRRLARGRIVATLLGSNRVLPRVPHPTTHTLASALPLPQVHALEARGITSLFPIQKTVFEPAMAGHDLIARAKTGSGALGLGLVLQGCNHRAGAQGLQAHVGFKTVQWGTAVGYISSGCLRWLPSLCGPLLLPGLRPCTLPCGRDGGACHPSSWEAPGASALPVFTALTLGWVAVLLVQARRWRLPFL